MFKRFITIFFSKKQISFEVLRCNLCHKITTNFSIEKGILCPCGENRWVRTNPTLLEKIRLIVKYVLTGQ